MSIGSRSKAKGCFTIEWRVKADASPMPYGEMKPLIGQKVLGHEWEPLPYNIEQMFMPSSETNLIRPYILKHDEEMAHHGGLVTRKVGEAIIACFKTVIDAQSITHGMLDSIEYRLVEHSWSMEWKAEPLVKEET